MAYGPLATPFNELVVTGYASNAGSQTGGIKTFLVAPCRGRVLEVGFVPASYSAATAWTMQVDAIDNFAGVSVAGSVVASTVAVTSTLGTFASNQTQEGAICSVIPASAVFVNRGDVLKFTHSGGATSAIGATVYALIRRA